MRRLFSNKGSLLALLWALVLALAVYCLLRPLPGPRFESSLLALLPSDAQDPLVNRAVDSMAQAASSRVILLCGNQDEAKAIQSADTLAATLRGQAGILHVLSAIEGDPAKLARDFYFPYRYQVLSDAERQRLQNASDQEILTSALEAIYSPVGIPRMAPLEADPFGSFTNSLLEMASQSSLHFDNGHLGVLEGQTHWIAVLVEVGVGMSVAEQKSLLASFDAGERAALTLPGSQCLRAGFVFHAAEAAKQAQREVSTVGLGSMLGILLIVYLALQSFWPLLLVALPILAGTIFALAFSPFLIGRPHLLTLVFGSSIIGVAVDYGVLFLSGAASQSPWNAETRRRQILRPVSMAILTSLIAYATLASLPFPILRQMGIFTMLGLCAAWLTAMLWLPLLATHLQSASQSTFVRFLRRCEASWPRFQSKGPRAWLFYGVCVFLGLGALRLHSNDDVRQLYASDATTQNQEEHIQSLLKLPASGQFFLVQGKDDEAVLQREEGLRQKLDSLRAEGKLQNYECVSRFVPSQARQAENAALLRRRFFNTHGLSPKLFAELESPSLGVLSIREAQKKLGPLTLGPWLASPLSEPFRSLWLGFSDQGAASLVALNPGEQALDLPRLESMADPKAGISFVDHFATLDAMMKSFRERVSLLLLLGYLVVSLFVAWIYRGAAWRVLAPALLGSLLVAGLFGWLGLNFNLFSVFGILLSLDMGLDYGIFMQDRQSGEFSVALLSASLAALSTLLSFGLLALSSTPALHLFGLSVLLGIGTAWLLAPVFTKEYRHE